MKEDETKSFFEVMGIKDFKFLVSILLMGAVMTLPLLLACCLGEYLNSL